MFTAIKKSLGGKIILAVMGVLVVFVTALTLAGISNERDELMATSRRNAGLLVATIEKAFVSLMKEGRNDDVQKMLESVGTQEDIIGIRIFDEKGNILRSTDRGEVGGMVDKDTLEYYRRNKFSVESSGEGSTMYSLLKPIYNGPQCYGCHPPAKKVNGVLDVRISLDSAYMDMARNRSFMFKFALLTVLSVGLFEMLLLRHLVIMPVKKLRYAMRRAEKGEEFTLGLKYDDELGDLGQVFKGMMMRISDLNHEALERERALVISRETVKAQSMLSAVIDGMPDGVAIISWDMRLVQTNPRHKQIFPNAEIGETCYSCIHGRDEVCAHCGVVKVFEDGKVHDHHSTLALPDGTTRVVHSISAPIWDGDGKIVNAVEVVRDVTERVAMEKDIKEKSWELERANKKLSKMAVTDGLTMLFNHRFFQDSLKREFKRLARHRALPFLSLAMIDLDNFKRLNDTFGHQAGDRVLRGISRLLKDGVRTTDIVARYGGEEFVIIMPETDFGGTEVVAERLRQTIENAVFAYKEDNLKVTVSIGLASYPQENIRSEDELIKAADRALYKAKELGKNRVVISNGDEA